MSGESWQVDTRDKAKSFCQYVMQQAEEGIDRIYSIKRASRSLKQNNALHLLFRQIAEELNNAGFAQKHPWGKMEIPYSEQAVKEIFYRPILDRVYQKEHSSELTTKELSESVDILLDALAQNTNIVLAMPQHLRAGSV